MSLNPGCRQPSRLRAVLGLLIAYAAIGSFLKGQQQAEPNSGDALFQSGMASLSKGKHQEAEEAFRKLYAQEPANPRGILGVAEVYVAQNRNDDAIRLLQAEAEKNPTRLEYRMAIGNVALHAAQFDLAIAEFQRVLDGVDKNSKAAGETYFRLAEAYRHKGDLDFSIAALRQAQKLLPGNAMVSNVLAFTLDGAGQKKAAEEEYRAILKSDSNNGLVYNNLAFLIAENGGDLGEALAFAHRAKQLVPDAAAISDTLGWIYLKKNMVEEAIGVFREAVKKDRAQSIFRYHLAMALDQKGEHLAAKDELNTALQSNPSKDDEQKIKELLQKIGN